MRILPIVLGLIPLSCFAESFVFISHEQFFTQTGPQITVEKEGKFYADVQGIEDVSSAIVTASAGLLNEEARTLVNDGGELEYAVTYPSIASLLQHYPLGINYTISLFWPVFGSVGIPVPAGPFADKAPVTPLFTITGVEGTWSTTPEGWGVFTFEATETTEFTVTINDYVGPSTDGHYAYYLEARTGNDIMLAEIGDGPLEGDTEFTAPVFEFKYGLAENNDLSDEVVGFEVGSVIQLEAGFFHIHSLSDTGIGDDSRKGSIFGKGNEITLIAVAPAEKPDLWVGAFEDPSGWRYLEWFGWFYPQGEWINHQEHGWLFCVGEKTDYIFVYDNALQMWLWTTDFYYPWLYAFEPVESWLWYLRNGTPGNRWFLNLNAGVLMPETELKEIGN